LLAPLYKRFSDDAQIRAFVQGVTAAATGAIAGAVVVLGRHSIRDVWTLTIALATFLILTKWKVSEPIIIGISGLVGIAIHLR
jgi:chromate transporter